MELTSSQLSKSLLDTNIISAFMKGNPLVIEAISRYLKRNKCLSLSIITYYELLRGLKSLGSPKKISSFYSFMSQCEIIPLNQPTAETAADIYATLKSQGLLIEDADILIAATALNKSLSLVTDNYEHFKRVQGLKLYNWLSK